MGLTWCNLADRSKSLKFANIEGARLSQRFGTTARNAGSRAPENGKLDGTSDRFDDQRSAAAPVGEETLLEAAATL